MILRYSILICFLSTLGAQIDYNTIIQPIFNAHCTNCHGASGGLNLYSYDNLMNGGNSGDVVIPYDHASSLLWQYVNSGFMPPGNNDLTTAQIDLIAQWIDEGAVSEAEYQMELNLTFQGEQNIIPTEHDEKFPDMISDSQGNIHMVWMAQNGGSGNITYTRTEDGGDTFSESIQVNNISGNVITYTQSGPMIKIFNGILYVVYMDNRSGPMAVYMNKSEDNGNSWGEDMLVSDQMYMQMYPEMEIDSQGTLHLIYYNFFSNNLIQDVRYAVMEAGENAFSPSVVVGLVDEYQEPCDCCQPDLYITDTDDLYLLYRNNISNIRDTFLVTKLQGETVFSEKIQVSYHNDFISQCPSSGPTLAINNDNVAASYYVTQESDAFISFSDLQSLAFSNEINVNNTEELQNFPHIIMHENYIHSVWVDQSLGNPDIYYGVTEFGSGLMRNLQKVNQNNEDSYIMQADAMLLWVENTLYCSWSDRRSGTYQVYLAAADLYPDYPYFELNSVSYEESQGDFDQMINPGESVSLIINLVIPASWYVGGEDIFITITGDESFVEIENDELFVGEMEPGDEYDNSDEPVSISFANDAPPGNYQFNLSIESNVTQEFSFNIEVTLQQYGFPLEIAAMVRSSPIVVDIDNNGRNEVIFGDYNGIIHVINDDGTEVIDETFPFDTGNQIWGSPAAADLDGDGLIDFVIASKSKHLYIFDQNGLKTDYDAELYLIGTPAIGNLDDDPDLEVVFSGYSSNNKVFVINHDGSDVDGFPLELDEKVKAGIALADFNNNGKEDIVLGTDSDHIFLIYDDGGIAPGFPYLTTDKVQSAPAILDIDGEKIILAGCNDYNLYAINSDGNLLFSILTGNKVQSSPSFLNHNGEIYIFFGSDDNHMYAVDPNGNNYPGWPLEVGGTVAGSIVFSDLDDDNEPEIIAALNSGEIKVIHFDGSEYFLNPVIHEIPFTGSATIADLDGDGDLEIFAGSADNLVAIDVKEPSNNNDYWNTYRGNQLRNGYYEAGVSCGASLGDVTGDGNINILDLVQIANLILEVSTPAFECAADFTGDGNVNILDLVQIANYILDN